VVERAASGDADQVETRLREALNAHGLQLFARILDGTGKRSSGRPRCSPSWPPRQSAERAPVLADPVHIVLIRPPR
jgi:hypothetical protein